MIQISFSINKEGIDRLLSFHASIILFEHDVSNLLSSIERALQRLLHLNGYLTLYQVFGLFLSHLSKEFLWLTIRQGMSLSFRVNDFEYLEVL